MKRDVRLPLRTLLPLLLLVLLTAQGVYLVWHTNTELKQTLQTNAAENLRFLLTRMQGTLDYLATTRQYDQIYAELASLGTDYNMDLGVLVDENNLILASIHLADLTRPLDHILPDDADTQYLLTQLNTIRVHRKGQIWTDSDGNLTGAYPVQLGLEGNEIRPLRIGILIITRNLTIPYQQLGQHLLDSVAPVAIVMTGLVLAFGAVLHSRITRRIQQLVAAAEQGARGRYRSEIDIQGKDEIALLARTLETMFKQIAYTQSELRRSEQLYAQAQKAADIGSWEWNLLTDKVVWSGPLEAMFGYAPGEFPGTAEAVAERTHPADKPLLKQALKDTLEGRRDYRVERRIILPDGSLRWIDITGEVVRNDQGLPERMFGIAQDVTARKQAEEALRASEAELRRHRDHLEEMILARTAELEAVITELESFSYSVSHDLRAPLRAIAGFSDVLLEDYAGQLDDQGRHYLDRIRNGAERIGELIDDLLNLSRVTRGELKIEPTDMGDLFDEVIQELRRGDPTIKAEFICDCESTAEVDRRLTRILLTNLLSNSVKFSRRRPDPRIECGSVAHGNERVYYVRDNGVGFDDRYADRLFTPFQRLHNPNEFEGTGIGLATARRVMRRHGGHIWAESSPGRGAVFYFTFGRINLGEGRFGPSTDTGES